MPFLHAEVPASGFTTIKMPEEISNASVTIHDLQGREVYYSKLNPILTKVPLSKLNSGVYIITISDEKQIRLKDKLLVF